MKKILLSLLTSILLNISFAQQKENNVVKLSATGTLSASTGIDSILASMQKQNNGDIFNSLMKTLHSGPFRNSSPDAEDIIANNLNTNFIKISNGRYEMDNNSTIIFLFRGISKDATNNLNVDGSSLNTIIFHNDATGKQSNYLLNTKNVAVIYMDVEKEFYKDNPDLTETQITNSEIKINYRNSFLKQSFSDLKKVLNLASTAGGAGNFKNLIFTINLIDYKQVKAPCDIVIQHKTFTKDLSFTIHEKNAASFQVGIVNNQYSLNQFSISGGNLIVKPNNDLQKNWKSNAFALLELHIPRDIDNFQPVWKVAFGKNPYHNKSNFGRWLYNITLDRIGIYGGLKISKDPLSNLYSGFTYSLTKEVSVNFGWSWENQVIPQVTEIGNITSIDDAVKYAKRDYSGRQFSWGLTFSPSAILSMFSKDDDTSK